MRYRKQSATGDYTFGQGQANFYVNNPEAVAQAIETRLLLMQGEWFLDILEGTPYATQILGRNRQTTYDAAIRKAILDTQGVISIESYASQLSADRELNVQARVNTIYGEAALALQKVFPQ